MQSQKICGIDPRMAGEHTEYCDRVAAVVSARTNLQLPTHAGALAACLGLDATPWPGAPLELRGRELRYDASLDDAEQDRLVARGCAIHVLGCGWVRDITPPPPKVGIGDAELNEIDELEEALARALCG